MSHLRLLPLAFMAAMILLIGLGGCISDAVSTSSSDVLSFSTEVVEFDTIFTDQGSPTARLKVYNKAGKGVVVSSIRFADPDGDFSMNVDGVSASEFRDVEIRGGDSIFVFIECFIEPDDNREPFLREDKIEFVTNGVTQTVTCQAYGQNVVRLKDVTVTEDMTLTDELPYVIFGNLDVAEGALLKVSPGARLLFHDKAELMVHGRIEAVGEPGKMIQMRGDRLDDVLPDVGYDIMAGQWGGITICEGSVGNRLEYVDMRSTVHGLVCEPAETTDTPLLTLVDSWLHNSQGSVLSASGGSIEAAGVCFSEAADAVVSLTGGRHTFSQCTIANYYLFSAISAPMLSLYHVAEGEEGDEAEGDLMSLNFDNGIIYGLVSPLNIGDFDGTDVWMRNVLLGVEGSDDEHFINCLWDSDPLFCTVREDYLFNYHVRPDSPAIGAGNPEYVSPLTLTDMDGVERLAGDLQPTLGAYARPYDPESAE